MIQIKLMLHLQKTRIEYSESDNAEIKDEKATNVMKDSTDNTQDMDITDVTLAKSRKEYVPGRVESDYKEIKYENSTKVMKDSID